MMRRAVLVALVLSGTIDAFQVAPVGRLAHLRPLHMCSNDSGNKKDEMGMMQRPVLDNVVTKSIYSLEALRIKMMKENPSEENGGWNGEPRVWANEDSLAQKVSRVSQVGVFASLKQWIAESIAGDYDKAAINKRIDDALAASPIVMFSFTTCPFCLKVLSSSFLHSRQLMPTAF
jgi:hypothetical protein